MYLFNGLLDDESDTATEGEEEIKAREIRKQEVCLRIPNISSATTDTGSDTEVKYFTPPKSIENSLICLNEHSESIRNDQTSQSIITNTLNIKKSPNSLNSNFICIPEYTDRYNLKNNIASLNTKVQKYPIQNCDVPLNNIITSNNNMIKIANSLSLNNCNFQNQSKNVCIQQIKNDVNPKSENTNKFPLISNSISTDKLVIDMNSSLENDTMHSIDNDHSNELETSESSINCVKYKRRQQSKNNNTSPSLKTHNDSIGDNAESLSNSYTSNSNLSEKIIDVKNYSKPTKLNMVTTEPYPKYTPTVEKAIKKYENKQPKKECIVM